MIRDFKRMERALKEIEVIKRAWMDKEHLLEEDALKEPRDYKRFRRDLYLDLKDIFDEFKLLESLELVMKKDKKEKLIEFQQLEQLFLGERQALKNNDIESLRRLVKWEAALIRQLSKYESLLKWFLKLSRLIENISELYKEEEKYFKRKGGLQHYAEAVKPQGLDIRTKPGLIFAARMLGTGFYSELVGGGVPAALEKIYLKEMEMAKRYLLGLEKLKEVECSQDYGWFYCIIHSPKRGKPYKKPYKRRAYLCPKPEYFFEIIKFIAAVLIKASKKNPDQKFSFKFSRGHLREDMIVVYINRELLEDIAAIPTRKLLNIKQFGFTIPVKPGFWIAPADIGSIASASIANELSEEELNELGRPEWLKKFSYNEFIHFLVARAMLQGSLKGLKGEDLKKYVIYFVILKVVKSEMFEYREW